MEAYLSPYLVANDGFVFACGSLGAKQGGRFLIVAHNAGLAFHVAF